MNRFRQDDAVVGVTTGEFPARRVGHEGASLLQAGQHTGHPLDGFQATVEGLDDVLLTYTPGSGKNRDALLVCDPPHPGLVGVGALLEHGWLNAGDAYDIVEEVHQVFRALQALEVAVQHDAIPLLTG